MALYRRALASLGSPEQNSNPSPLNEEPESPGETEDNEEDETENAEETQSPSPKLPNSSMDLNSARMTVTV